MAIREPPLFFKLLALAAVIVLVPAMHANATITSGVLHLDLQCSSSVLCNSVTYSGGSMIGSSSPLPTFGVTLSPQGQTANFPNLVLTVLVPSQYPTLTFTVNGTGTGAATKNSGAPSSLKWSNSGSVGGLPLLSTSVHSFLGVTAGILQCNGCGPASPLSTFLGATHTVNPANNGFSIYLVEMGAVTFGSASKPNPLLSFSGIGSFPTGTIFYTFLTNSKLSACSVVHPCVVGTTATSSALVVTPESSSMLLWGAGMILLGGVIRLRKSLAHVFLS